MLELLFERGPFVFKERLTHDNLKARITPVRRRRRVVLVCCDVVIPPTFRCVKDTFET